MIALNSTELDCDVPAVGTATGCDMAECRNVFKQLKENYEDTITKMDELGTDGREVKIDVT